MIVRVAVIGADHTGEPRTFLRKLVHPRMLGNPRQYLVPPDGQPLPKVIDKDFSTAS